MRRATGDGVRQFQLSYPFMTEPKVNSPLLLTGPERMQRSSAMKILEPFWDDMNDLSGDLEISTPADQALPAVSNVASKAPAEAQKMENDPLKLSKGEKHPWMIDGWKDLLYHFGPWVFFFLGLQVLAAGLMGLWARAHTNDPFLFVFITQLVISIALDFCVVTCMRGSLKQRFIKPAAILFAVTILPGVIAGFADFMIGLGTIS